MNTTESNKLIAEFMGLNKTKEGKFIVENENDYNTEIYSHYRETNEYLTIESGIIRIHFEPYQLYYHFDWNWLMPVVEKIEETDVFPETENAINVTIGATSYCVIKDSYGEKVEITTSEITKIKTVYKAVIEFIKWYNETVKSNQKKGDV